MWEQYHLPLYGFSVNYVTARPLDYADDAPRVHQLPRSHSGLGAASSGEGLCVVGQ